MQPKLIDFTGREINHGDFLIRSKTAGSSFKLEFAIAGIDSKGKTKIYGIGEWWRDRAVVTYPIQNSKNAYIVIDRDRVPNDVATQLENHIQNKY